MARQVKDKKVIKKVVDIRQKILVAEGGKIDSDKPYKILHTEVVASAPIAKTRVEELKGEYPEASISYFSI